MNDILKSWLVSIVKHGLSILAAYFIKRGLIDPASITDANLGLVAAGLATGAISLGWVLWGKLRQHNLVEAALEAPSGTPIGVVKTEAEAKPVLKAIL